MAKVSNATAPAATAPAATAPAATAPAATAPAATAPAATAPAATSTPRVAPVVTTVSSAVPMPVRVKGKRGTHSLFPFDKLEVGASFGVKDRDAKSMASIVSAANKRFVTDKVDADGKPVFKMIETTGADGTVTKVPSVEREKEASRHFFAHNTDAKTDPDGATVRIFRDK